MDNPGIRKLLETQRDSLFKQLKATSISALHKEQYEDIKAGRVFVFDGGERKMLRDLKQLIKDNSFDEFFQEKLNEYLDLDEIPLIAYFEKQFEKVFDQIKKAEKEMEVQAIFIEYDYYYHFTSSVSCYGIQEYPLIEELRYIPGEFDFDKQVLFLDEGINFQPAWLDCEGLGNLEYLDINYDLENLFRLHSRVLLHKALHNLDAHGRLGFLRNRPFSFYINEHDCEVMLLYRLN